MTYLYMKKSSSSSQGKTNSPKKSSKSKIVPQEEVEPQDDIDTQDETKPSAEVKKSSKKTVTTQSKVKAEVKKDSKVKAKAKGNGGLSDANETSSNSYEKPPRKRVRPPLTHNNKEEEEQSSEDNEPASNEDSSQSNSQNSFSQNPNTSPNDPLSGIISPRKPNEAPDVYIARAKKEIDSFLKSKEQFPNYSFAPDEIAEKLLEKELDKYQKYEAKLKSAYSQERQKIIDAEAQKLIDQSKKTTQGNQSSQLYCIFQLKRRYDQINKEYDELSKQLDDIFETINSKKSEIKSKETDLSDLKEYRKNEKAYIKKFNDTRNTVIEVQKYLQTLQKEIEFLRNHHQTVTYDPRTELNEENAKTLYGAWNNYLKQKKKRN